MFWRQVSERRLGEVALGVLRVDLGRVIVSHGGLRTGLFCQFVSGTSLGGVRVSGDEKLLSVCSVLPAPCNAAQCPNA